MIHLINNNTQAIIPIGTHNSVDGSPAVNDVVPDNATGVFFTMSFTGYYTYDGTTAGSVDGILFRNQGPINYPPQILHLYPGCPVSFFSMTGNINYQFFRTADHKSLLTRS
jgi:hypothetical protein